MSYKWDLSDIDRGAATSLTQQLVDLVARRIDAGELEPGEKLPPTRELAAAAGVNHLTAARVYRRLAELGYVTAAVARATFVRTVPPMPANGETDDWQPAGVEAAADPRARRGGGRQPPAGREGLPPARRAGLRDGRRGARDLRAHGAADDRERRDGRLAAGRAARAPQLAGGTRARGRHA